MIYENITTVYELENDERFKKHNEFFFSPDTLAFFGDKKSEMKILKKHVDINGHECLVLSCHHHNAPKLAPKTSYYYFDVNTLERIFED